MIRGEADGELLYRLHRETSQPHPLPRKGLCSKRRVINPAEGVIRALSQELMIAFVTLGNVSRRELLFAEEEGWSALGVSLLTSNCCTVKYPEPK